MKSGKKLMRKLATSQTSRFKVRRNTSKLGLPEDKTKVPRPKKLQRIIKNPRFYNNVKEKIKSSVQMLANVKQGGRMDREIYQNKIQYKSKKDKDSKILSFIYR